MTDIRKRVHKSGATTYQVRHPCRSSKAGYAYKTFRTLKEARHFIDVELPKQRNSRHSTFRTIEQAVDKWLDVCRDEGREGKDPVSPATLRVYESRAAAIKRYDWTKQLHELETADVVAFRSWLLKTH